MPIGATEARKREDYSFPDTENTVSVEKRTNSAFYKSQMINHKLNLYT